jgi:dTDP-glucose pyrophosphorylase
MIYNPDLCVKQTMRARDAWKIINQGHDWNTLFVLSENDSVQGTLTDGDIRRGILDGKTLEDPIQKFVNESFQYLPDTSEDMISFRHLHQRGIRQIPVLNSNRVYVGHYDTEKTFCKIPASACILAGGKGVRMQPLTLHTPKPLLEIQGVPLLGRILDYLIAYGIEEVHLALHHEAERIKKFCDSWVNERVKLYYIIEDQPMGTAGALSSLKSAFDWTFVINADLMTDLELDKFFASVNNSKALAGIVSSSWKTDIPFALLETDKNNLLSSIREKPELSVPINAGIYLIHRQLISSLPKGQRIDMPELFSSWIKIGHKIFVFAWPGFWKDLGRPEDFYSIKQDT